MLCLVHQSPFSSDGLSLAVGAPHHNVDGTYRSGGVYTFKNNASGQWVPMTTSPLPGDGKEDFFGWSVSLSRDGTRLAVGAPKDGSLLEESGYARIYEYIENAGIWNQISEAFSRGVPGDQFGFSVSLAEDGKRVAIGAYRASGNGEGSGLACVYEESESNFWQSLGADLYGASEGDNFGFAVSLSSDGSRLAVGAPKRKNNEGNHTGEVIVHEIQAGSWVASNGIVGVDGGQLGFSVALSGDGRVVGTGDARSSLVRAYQ